MKWKMPDQEVDQTGLVSAKRQAHKLNRKDAMDHSRWRKQIKDDR